MKPNFNDKPVALGETDQKRLLYESPAIIYEGTITIRAGSPIGGFIDGPPNPFGGPPGSK